MALFHETNGLSHYKNDNRIKQMLNGCELMNHEEFLEWYLPPEIKYSKRIESEYSGSAKRRKIENIEVGKYARQVLLELAENVCASSIDADYGRTTMRNLKKLNRFDLLVAVKNPEAKKNTSKQNLSSVVAFIIVEKGECSIDSDNIDRSDVYSVNLICRREDKPNKTTVKAVVLLGAYMYCIKNNENMHVKDKLGILELAGAYTNLSGFFSYTKMGFDKDNSLFAKTCFKDADNLPMSVDINQYSSEDIIQMVSGEKKRDVNQIKDDTGIYELGLPDKHNKAQVENQLLIAQICSLQHLMNVNYKELKKNDELQTLLDEILQSNPTKQKRRQLKDEKKKEEKQIVQDYLDEVMLNYQRQNKNVSGGKRKTYKRKRKSIKREM